MKIKFLFAALIMFAFCADIHAQTKTPAKPTMLAKKYKVPKMTVMIGSYADSVSISAAEASSILDRPLRIMDDKKTVYTVTSYQFLYRKLTVSETEDGRPIPATSISSQSFTTTPLPQIWVANIRDQVKTGEYLYFFDIIVKDPQGRVMYAPSLKINVR